MRELKLLQSLVHIFCLDQKASSIVERQERQEQVVWKVRQKLRLRALHLMGISVGMKLGDTSKSIPARKAELVIPTVCAIRIEEGIIAIC